jgi:pimeloyl-ACP methyl ester carboxylesterase
MAASVPAETGIRVRVYGASGSLVIVLHGGPGAPGYMAPVARGLADRFRVVEPLQRGSGARPLTVARHVADLHQVVVSYCADALPALVGHSWGAMLALAYAAAYPARVASLVLIGCGTFDPVARNRLQAIRESRMDDEMRRRMARLQEAIPDPDERLRALGDLVMLLDSYELITSAQEMEACDARAHHETWEDMVRLQEEGIYPAAFSAIDAPVIMLHGALDPHPGRMIQASLAPYLPQLEYHEWERCGHYPWLERAARDEFFAVLRMWLVQRFVASSARGQVEGCIMDLRPHRR